MHKIEAEIVRATRFKTHNKKGQVLLRGLVEAVQKLSDDQWEELTDDTQKWVNLGVDAIQNDKPVPKFSAVVDDEEDEAEDEPPPKAKKAAAKKKVKPAKKKVSHSRPVSGAPNANTLLKIMVLRNPQISNSEIMDGLVKAGFEPTTFFIATAKSNFKHALRVIKQEGIDVRKLDV